jgi:PKD repeat protein
MKYKVITGLMFLLLSAAILTFELPIQRARANGSTPSFEVVPNIAFANISGGFQVSVVIFNVTDLLSFEYKLYWNSSIINCTGYTKSDPATVLGWDSYYEVKDDLTEERHWYAVVGLYTSMGFAGNATFATYSFQVLKPGNCTIDLMDHKLVDSFANMIPHSGVDGLLADLYLTALFTYSPALPVANETVTFTAYANYNPNTTVSFHWDFGDNTTSSGQIATHMYTAAGTYNVTLNVTDSEGLWDTQSQLVTLGVPVSPFAVFTFKPTNPTANSTVTFNATESNDPDRSIISYIWNFGDNTTGSGVIATHAYTAEGAYNVTLTVTDTTSLNDTTWQMVNVGISCYYSFSRSVTWAQHTRGDNITLERTHGPFPLICSYNITFSPPDANGVRNLTAPKESFHFEPVYLPYDNLTWTSEWISDGYGKMYTQPNGDVDIISMTNDTGTFFRKGGAWHPAGEEWIGDGTPDPANSSWFYMPVNITHYRGEGTDGEYIGYHTLDTWWTTGFTDSIVNETDSRLYGYYVNGTGVPFAGVGGTVTYISAGARLNIPELEWSPEDKQWLSDLGGGSIPVSSGTLFSPADLYITDPINRSIGTPPNGTPIIPQIPDSFYTGPNSEPERIIIPNPINGTYEILITGTGNGTYGFMVDFAFSMNLSERTKAVYYGSIVEGGVLWTKVIVSGKEVKSYTPVSTVGDINQDALVDIVDIVTCALAYGSETQDNPETLWDETEDWNPLTDLDLNEIIDIVDLVKIAIHFGETV